MKMNSMVLALLTAVGMAGALTSSASQSAPAHGAVTFGMKTEEATHERLKSVFDESYAYKTFLDRLQSAVAADQKMTVSRMVAYPFQTRVDGIAITLRNRWQFREVYDKVMTAEVISAIKRQAFNDLLVGPSGVGIGGGDLWFADTQAGNDTAIKIIAINQRGDYGA